MRQSMRFALAAVLSLPSTILSQVQETRSAPDPTVALGISLAATAGPLILATSLERSGHDSPPADAFAIGAVVIGPASGYWYAHSPEWKRGVIMRAVLTTGTLLLWDGANHHCQTSCLGMGLGALLFGAAALGSAVQDITRVPAAAERVNEGDSRLSILPTYSPSSRRLTLTAHLTF